MVSSLDGFIARHDKSIGWFNTSDHYANGIEAPDNEGFLQTIDCYVMGSNTYAHACELAIDYGWPYGETPVVVMSQRELLPRQHVQIFKGQPSELTAYMNKSGYRNVWLVGGAKLANAFMQLGLINEIRQTILPIILGDGLRFYKVMLHEQPLHLKNVTAYKNGIVELWYEIKE